MLGGAGGMLLARWLADAFLAVYPGALPRGAEIHMDGGVTLFALVLPLAAGTLFGVVPVLQWRESDVLSGLRGLPRPGALPKAWSAQAVVGGEVAISVILTICVGLLTRTLVAVQRGDLGFDPDRVLTMFIRYPDSGYTIDPRKNAYVQQVLDRIASTAGVQSASLGSAVAPGGTFAIGVAAEGQVARPEDLPRAQFHVASGGYFRTLGVRVRDGRLFDDAEGRAGREVVVVNQVLARRLWPGARAVGRRISLRDAPVNYSYREPEWREVIGVVDDARNDGLMRAAAPAFFVPWQQSTQYGYYLQVKTAGRPALMRDALMRTVAAVDPSRPATRPATLDDAIGAATSRQRFLLWVLAGFSACALALMAVGIYTLTSVALASRERELVIRAALGASAAEIFVRALRYGAAIAVAGLPAGLIGAVGATRVLRSQLFGVTPTDPATFGAMAALVLVLVFATCALAARRVPRLSPADVLRATT